MSRRFSIYVTCPTFGFICGHLNKLGHDAYFLEFGFIIGVSINWVKR